MALIDFLYNLPVIRKIPGFDTLPKGINPKHLRFYQLSNLVLTLGMFIHASWVALFGYLEIYTMFFINIVSVAIYIANIIINRRGYYFTSSVIMVSEIILHQMFAVRAIGWEAGFQYYIIVIGLFPFLMPEGRWLSKSFLLGACVVTYVLFDILLKKTTPLYVIESGYITYLRMSNIVFSFISLSISGAYFNIAMHRTERQLEKQTEALEHEKRKITDSITYAQRIQKALLPATDNMQQVIPDFFILYKPRDIVSGDFYWFNGNQDGFTLATADCTGHGVPGALMSMIGISLLDKIVYDKQLLQPAQILDELQQELQKALRQSQTTISDGMDISIYSYNFQTRELVFAAAKSDIVLVNEQGVEMLSGDKYPIGETRRKRQPYTQKTMTLAPNTMIYSFSDGYADQFGGEHDHKFMLSRQKKLMHEIHALPCQEQQQKLLTDFTKWMGNNSQIDDVLIIGVRT